MKRIEPYLPEQREQIISDYLRSGLSINKYCQRPDVPVAETTLTRWVSKHAAPATPAVGKSVPSAVPEQFVMACYTVAAASPTGNQSVDRQQRLSLEQMILFHHQVYECCCTLQQLVCTAENAAKVKYLMELL